MIWEEEIYIVWTLKVRVESWISGKRKTSGGEMVDLNLLPTAMNAAVLHHLPLIVLPSLSPTSPLSYFFLSFSQLHSLLYLFFLYYQYE